MEKTSKTYFLIYHIEKAKSHKAPPIKVYHLQRILENGERHNLTEEEFENLKLTDPEIYNLLTSYDQNAKKNQPKNNLSKKRTKTWQEKANQILNKLKASDSKRFFKDPVNEKKWNITGYYNIIKNPMDFKTIEGKLERGIYPEFEDFCNDVNLIFNNSFQFNAQNEGIIQYTNQIKEVFEKLLKELS